VPELEDIWLPLVDEPIGSIVERIQRDNADIDRLVGAPRRVLAFRTFAYIRVGIAIGRLLFDNDLPQYDGSDAWVDGLLRDHGETLTREVRAVAEEIAADPKYADDEQFGPDEAARERTRSAFFERLDAGV
jgi:hypothetical protein